MKTASSPADRYEIALLGVPIRVLACATYAFAGATSVLIANRPSAETKLEACRGKRTVRLATVAGLHADHRALRLNVVLPQNPPAGQHKGRQRADA